MSEASRAPADLVVVEFGSSLSVCIVALIGYPGSALSAINTDSRRAAQQGRAIAPRRITNSKREAHVKRHARSQTRSLELS
jgi:hypothetical protein